MSAPGPRMDSSASPSRQSPRRSYTYHYEDDRHRPDAKDRSFSIDPPQPDATSPTLLSHRGSARSPARIRADGPPDDVHRSSTTRQQPDDGIGHWYRSGETGSRSASRDRRAQSMQLDDGSIGRLGQRPTYGAPGPGYLGSPSPHSPSPSPSPATSPNARFAHSVPHSPIAPEGPRGHGTPPKGPAVLIPTDRPIDELLHRWMGGGRRRRFRVDSEVRLVGYGLWTNRDWFLARDRFSLSILTLTHKPSDIVSLYRLVPAAYFDDGPDGREYLSALEGGVNLHEAEEQVAALLKELMLDVKGQVRKTDWGSLIISTPRGTGQDSFAVPAGDMRVVRPLLMLTTGLRRLGCSGRAALPLWLPDSTAQRKFYETYRIPQAPNTPSTPSTGSTGTNANSSATSQSSSATVSRNRSVHATSSPVRSQTMDPTTNAYSSSPHRSPSQPAGPSSSPTGWIEPLDANVSTAITDPFHLMVLEVVKLIQASLAIWGLFPYADGVEVDGLFCNATKQAMEDWRKAVSWQEDDGIRKDREGRGGCIEPRTLAGLLSSVTSTYYQLANMDIDSKLPKDPFTKMDKFLASWHSFQQEYRYAGSSQQPQRYFSVPLLRKLAYDFASARARSAADPLKVPRLIKATVANAASAIKLALPDDGPLRKREYLRDLEDAEEDALYGRRASSAHDSSDLIMSDGATAAPNVMIANLEAFTQSILRTSHKDQPELGARRIWVLWSGSVDELVRSAETARVKARAAHSSHAGTESWSHGQQGMIGHADSGHAHGYSNGYTHARKNSKGTDTEGEGLGHGGAGVRAAAAEAMRRTGTVLKGGVGLLVPVARRGTVFNGPETSDSEAATSRNVRKKASLTVPTVIEPEGGSQEQLHGRDRDHRSLSPSPSTTMLNHPRPSTVRSGSYLTTTSAMASKRPSIVTALTNGSDRSIPWPTELDLEPSAGPSRHPDSLVSNRARSRRESADLGTVIGADRVHRPHYDHLNLDLNALPRPSASPYPNSAPLPIGRNGQPRLYRTRDGTVYQEPPHGQRRLSTASDGADVLAEVNDNEWRVISPHGRGRGHQEDLLVHEMQRAAERNRRHSWHVPLLQYLDDRDEEEDREGEWEHLRIDIELAYTVFMLRKREQELAQRALQLKKLETTVFRASESLITAVRSRRKDLDSINKDADHLIGLFKKAPHDLADGSQALQELESRIRYRTTEDGGDSTRLAEYARNLRKEHHAAKAEWDKRVKTRQENKADPANATTEVLVSNEDGTEQNAEEER